MKVCATCGSKLDLPGRPWTVDCGGDCRICMVEAGDPDETWNLRQELIDLEIVGIQQHIDDILFEERAGDDL